MTDQPQPITLADVAALDHHEAIGNYLHLAALIAEARPEDAFDYLSTLSGAERVDMLLSGASMFVATMLDLHFREDVTEPFPAWLRHMAQEARRTAEDGDQ